MRNPRIHASLSVLFAFVLAMILPFLAAGCGDDSRTTGTQVERSEQQKQQVKDMSGMYKDMKGVRKKGE
jgi:hypothetical protein